MSGTPGRLAPRIFGLKVDQPLLYDVLFITVILLVSLEFVFQPADAGAFERDVWDPAVNLLLIVAAILLGAVTTHRPPQFHEQKAC